MVEEKDAGTRLISDIVYLTQRASANTCEITARTIERQTARHLKKHLGEIKNASGFEMTSAKLCKCILSLIDIVPGTGQEILTKRQALDLLLALSNEIEYPDQLANSLHAQPEKKYARTA